MIIDQRQYFKMHYPYTAIVDGRVAPRAKFWCQNEIFGTVVFEVQRKSPVQIYRRR